MQRVSIPAGTQPLGISQKSHKATVVLGSQLQSYPDVICGDAYQHYESLTACTVRSSHFSHSLKAFDMDVTWEYSSYSDFLFV